MDHHSEDRPEIVFFDVETIYNTSAIVEFGAIFVCPYTLTELRRPYSTLVRPDNPSLIPPGFKRRNGITRDALADAPTFADIADTVYELLHERIWAGHNILRFDCIHIGNAFSELNRPLPEARAIIDSLPLLTETFGKRAGDMKLASLAKYFGLGPQTHRSLDDVRMNLEVVKCCATIMFLESSPDMKTESMITSSSNTFVVLKAHEIFIPSLTPSFVSSPYHSRQRIQLLHNDSPFQISCADLKIRFGINDRFYNKAGLPKWNIVVYSSQSLCEVLEACDAIARNLFLHSGGSSEWNPVVTREDDFNSPTVRLQIAISESGDAAIFETEVFKKESSTGIVQRLHYNEVDTKELSSLCMPGNLVDAIFSLDQYDYPVYPQTRAGIRLVAKKMIFHK